MVICVILNFLISINYCHLNGFNLLMRAIKKSQNDQSNANLPPKYDCWNQDSLSDVTNKVWSNHSSISSKFPYGYPKLCFIGWTLFMNSQSSVHALLTYPNRDLCFISECISQNRRSLRLDHICRTQFYKSSRNKIS